MQASVKFAERIKINDIAWQIVPGLNNSLLFISAVPERAATDVVSDGVTTSEYKARWNALSRYSIRPRRHRRETGAAYIGRADVCLLPGRDLCTARLSARRHGHDMDTDRMIRVTVSGSSRRRRRTVA